MVLFVETQRSMVTVHTVKKVYMKKPCWVCMRAIAVRQRLLKPTSTPPQSFSLFWLSNNTTPLLEGEAAGSINLVNLYKRRLKLIDALFWNVTPLPLSRSVQPARRYIFNKELSFLFSGGVCHHSISFFTKRNLF